MLLPPHPTPEATAANNTSARKEQTPLRFLKSREVATTRTIAGTSNHSAKYEGAPRPGNLTDALASVVLTVSVDEAVPFAAGVTEAGLTAQVGATPSFGKTEQVKLTVLLKPYNDVMVSLELADWPAITKAGLTAEAVRLKPLETAPASSNTEPKPVAPPKEVVPKRLPSLSMINPPFGKLPSPFAPVKLYSVVS